MSTAAEAVQKGPRATAKRKEIQRPPLRQWMDDLGFAQRQRLRFFEARLLWEGQINRGAVCEQFDVTPNHVTREIADYRYYFPRNLEYDVTARAYRPTRQFKPQFSTGDSAEYLSLLKLYAVNPASVVVTELGSPIAAEILPDPQGQLSQVVLQQLLRAIHSGIGLRISYLSFSQSEEKERDIWPHAFLSNGDRWHVRAYDSRRKNYIDVVPQRITKAALLNEELPKEAGADCDWQEKEQIDVVPNPHFTLEQQALIAQEYGMKKIDGKYVWRVELRRCLVKYFLFRHRLDHRDEKSDSPLNSQLRIALRDPAVAKKFGFDAAD